MGTIEKAASKVTFLATSPKRGNITIKGPKTGIDYVIGPNGTPVSNHDVKDLLKVTGPPCCGETLPFGGQVRLFGVVTPTREQMSVVPNAIIVATRPVAERPRRVAARPRPAREEEVLEEEKEAVVEPQEKDLEE